MAKKFNVTADCKSDRHYMVNLDKRLVKIKELVDDGAYFMINRARQYGKTTTLRALYRYLVEDYYVVLMDFQAFDDSKFKNGHIFSVSFASSFLRILKANRITITDEVAEACEMLKKVADIDNEFFTLKELFEGLSDICAVTDKPVVLMIDEVDSATNNQVFLDFLAQLRAYYINRDMQTTFQSVILAGVHDIKNIRRKIRPEEDHKVNSPWNIATDFKIDMSFSRDEIAAMLKEYESDYHTGMDISAMAGMLYDYTSGYPFLVSRLCKLMDEEVYGKEYFDAKEKVWTKAGFYEAVKMILAEKNMLFESLGEKLVSYPELNTMLRSLLFTGKNISYNFYEPSINIATMFGFVKNQNGTLAVANRIFETWLYNFYLSTAEMQHTDIYAASLQDKSQFIVGGHLNVRRILEKFTVHFNELYGDRDEAFLEEEGRKYFLLYLRPIINGVGNYYIESRTRELRRTDIIVDYSGEQYIIEMKIWHGNEYNNRSEQQLIGYLDDYKQNKGYMVSFNFNKNKQISVHEIVIGDKVLIEAIV
ncbi:MAG: AAA-like domain-containing protein [Lachnospiraceae bacterium]|nr:AAA-like domain-containing protein [Lachnospiraceae bacterium]